jgi:hypothetical protein
VTIDTGGLVNRNLSEREFVATYGNRADAQDREIKALKEGQVSRPELEQQLAALKTENAQMRTDGQHAIDAISAENAALKTQLDQASRAPAAPVIAAACLWSWRHPGRLVTTDARGKPVGHSSRRRRAKLRTKRRSA